VDEEGVREVLEGLPEAPLALDQRLLGSLALGFVVGDDARCFPPVIRNNANADLDVGKRAIFATVASLTYEVVALL
jgi:hypothetical protein